MLSTWKPKKILPHLVYNALHVFRNYGDISSCLSFLRDSSLGVHPNDKLQLMRQLYRISFAIDSPHTQGEVLSFIRTILSLPPGSNGAIVEAGCFKGSTTAKFSLAAHMMGKTLVIFDSFQGIPDNEEDNTQDIFGGHVNRFREGDYCGTLDDVKRNVSRFGRIDCCHFIPGWFEDTMPGFNQSISAVYMDVDLASSTRTCLKYLFPLLEVGGVLYSQDGHLPLVVAVFDDDGFWLNEVGHMKPTIKGLGKSKLITIVKEQ